jgi:hypothetical protein
MLLQHAFALPTLLVQALLVPSQIVVALRLQVRREPIHLSDSLVRGRPGKAKHSDSGKNSQPGNPSIPFHCTRHPFVSNRFVAACYTLS